MSYYPDRCGICLKDFTENDLWEEVKEGVHHSCDKKLEKLAGLTEKDLRVKDAS